MAYLKQEDVVRFKALMRCMYFSGATVEKFLENATAGQVNAVSELVSSELENREARKRERLVKRARFPQIKSFSDYDFSQVALPEGYAVEDLKSLAFVDSAQDFVFHGQTGRGKTHLAIAMGLACAQSGREVRFYTAAELVLALTRANRENSLEALMKDLARARMLIVDEFGYVPLGQEGARLLFQVMSDCYERRSLVITTNIEFSKWGVVLGDDKLASALIDRLIHHGRLVEFNGGSRRMEQALMLGKAAEDKEIASAQIEGPMR